MGICTVCLMCHTVGTMCRYHDGPDVWYLLGVCPTCRYHDGPHVWYLLDVCPTCRYHGERHFPAGCSIMGRDGRLDKYATYQEALVR